MIPYPVLELKSITKYFKPRISLRNLLLRPFRPQTAFTALDDVSFSVSPGQIIGVVGRNGAGKSTLMRIVADLIQPDHGEVYIQGQRTSDDNTLRRRIGYVPTDDRSFFWRLNGMENLCFFSSLYGISRQQAQQRAMPLLDALALSEKKDVLFRDYSAGMRKKLALIRAMLHRPNVLLLDEITNNLDPESSQTAKALVREYASNQPNTVALWCTHRIEETAELCDGVLVLDRGHMRFLESAGAGPGTERSRYLLQVRNLDGREEEFAGRCSAISAFKHEKMHNINEYVFEDVTPTAFGDIVAMAVGDYDAQVSFAGCVRQKDQVA